MEKLERSKFTRAGEVANERLIEAVLDPDRYPEGTRRSRDRHRLSASSSRMGREGLEPSIDGL